MNYQVFTPSPQLKKYVRDIWMLEDLTGKASPRSFTVMCNGVPGLIFQQDPEAFTGFEGERLPQLFAFGQARRHGQLHGTGKFRTIGVTLQPAALKAIFGIDAAELTDRNTCLTHLAKTPLTEQLLDSNSVQQQVSCLSEFLLKQARRHDSELQARASEHQKITYAVSALQKGTKLIHILHDLNVSERSLERLFLTNIGISPILYARICRFQTSLSLLRQGKFRSLTDIAHSLGYFDQSHFIRDFKTFSGASPRIYLREAVEQMPGLPEWQ